MQIKQEKIVKPKYGNALKLSEEIASVQLGKKYWCIDESGKEIIEPKYDLVEEFSKNMVVIILDNKWGIIDRNGEKLLELKFDGIIKIDNDSFILKKSRYGRRIAYKVIDV